MSVIEEPVRVKILSYIHDPSLVNGIPRCLPAIHPVLKDPNFVNELPIWLSVFGPAVNDPNGLSVYQSLVSS